jgi:hypothetical protein
MEPEIVQVPRPAFAFCRVSLTVLLWTALWLHIAWLVFAVSGILLLSALLKVHRSPMIVLYRQTFLRLWPTERSEFLDVSAMRFAHGLGAGLALVTALTLHFRPGAGWWVLLGFCVLKTVSACGFCPASKLFVCLRKGGCCALTRTRC